MLVRREAASPSAGSTPTSSSTPTRPTSASGSGTQAGRSSTSRRRGPIHHDQMAQDAAGAERRIVEYHRGRDRYLRKHLGGVQAVLLRPLLAWPYLLRARRRRRPPRSLGAALLAARPPGAAAGPRRGDPRGRGGVQPAVRVARVSEGSRADPPGDPDVAQSGEPGPGQLPGAADAGDRGARPRGRGRVHQPARGVPDEVLRPWSARPERRPAASSPTSSSPTSSSRPGPPAPSPPAPPEPRSSSWHTGRTSPTSAGSPESPRPPAG